MNSFGKSRKESMLNNLLKIICIPQVYHFPVSAEHL